MNTIYLKNYAKHFDMSADGLTAYMGKAEIGTATSAALWQVKKFVFNAENDVIITWADGNDSYDNIWDNRAALSYS